MCLDIIIVIKLTITGGTPDVVKIRPLSHKELAPLLQGVLVGLCKAFWKGFRSQVAVYVTVVEASLDCLRHGREFGLGR